jgi:hypothetical protein
VASAVTIAAGHAQRSFRIRPLQVASPAAVTLSASLGGQATTAPLTVAPSSLMEIDIGAGPAAPNVFSGGTGYRADRDSHEQRTVPQGAGF